MTNAVSRRAWRAMVSRCHNEADRSYRWYGARGIEVCSLWRSSYEEFERYIASTIGPRPDGAHLDRINNDIGYEPGNVRWSSPKKNANNRSNSRLVTAFGETKTAAEWADDSELVSRQRIASRVSAGWSPEEAILTPSMHVPPQVVSVDGVDMTLSDASIARGVPVTTLRKRLAKGMDADEALDPRKLCDRGGTLRASVARALVRPMRPGEVAAEVDAPYDTVLATLSNMLRDGEIRRIKRGVYAPLPS